MADNEISTTGDLVFKPSARAFFVHYVAMALFVRPTAQSGRGAVRDSVRWAPSWGSSS